MKLFSAFLVFSFFFFIGCGDGGVARIVDETNNETVTDDDPTNPTDDPTNPTDDQTNPTDDPTNPTDDPTNPTDDPTNPTDDPTNPTDDPTNPTDDVDPTNPTDDVDPTDDDDPTVPTDDDDDPTVDTDVNPTPDEDDPTPDEDNPTPLTDAEKCANAGGTWSSWGQKCYRTETCDDKPANSEWNGNSSYRVYYDVNVGVWEATAYATEYGDGEPQPCQYVCAANYTYVGNDQCQKLCYSAKFNGTNSMITIASEDAPSIVGLDGWTIEAWIKQSADNLPNYQVYPILRKGTSTGDPEYLLSGYYNGSNGNGYGLTASTYYSYMQYNQQKKTNNQVSATLNTFPEGWSHVAMVYTHEGTGWSAQHKLTLFINGNLAKTGNYSGAPTFIPNDEPLVFGARNSDRYFTGLIDSIKFSDAALYTENFEPAKLSVDDNTIAFWDFNNNANDSVSGIVGTPANIEYSADCKE